MVEDFTNKANDALDKALGELNAVIVSYNETIEEINECRSDIQSKISDYIEDRSDAWRDSDRGSEYQEWSDEWAEELTTMDEHEIVQFDIPEFADPDAIPSYHIDER